MQTASLISWQREYAKFPDVSKREQNGQDSHRITVFINKVFRDNSKSSGHPLKEIHTLTYCLAATHFLALL